MSLISDVIKGIKYNIARKQMEYNASYFYGCMTVALVTALNKEPNSPIKIEQVDDFMIREPINPYCFRFYLGDGYISNLSDDTNIIRICERVLMREYSNLTLNEFRRANAISIIGNQLFIRSRSYYARTEQQQIQPTNNLMCSSAEQTDKVT